MGKTRLGPDYSNPLEYPAGQARSYLDGTGRRHYGVDELVARTALIGATICGVGTGAWVFDVCTSS